MSSKEEVYTIFNDEGRILQMEYGLEAVNNSLPLVVLKNKNMIVCVSKKNPGTKLDDEVQTSFQPVYTNIYSAFTGLWSDVHQINYESKNMASELSYKLGFPVTPDILCREMADKQQSKMQSIGERSLAFGGAYFGFDNSTPLISMTNISAVCYPVYGVTVGEKYQNMYKYIEKYYDISINDTGLIEIAIGAILESIGENSVYQEIEVAYLKEGGVLTYLSDNEIENLLLTISEK